MRRLRDAGKLKIKVPVEEPPESPLLMDPGVDEDLYKVHSRINSSRSRRERKDSVTLDILRERFEHLQRISNYHLSISDSDAARLVDLGLGQKTRKHLVYKLYNSNAGAGGKATHIGSARDNFPIFKHILPEIVLAGHTNSGKSTLVNALAGIPPRLGPAGVSDRAGWTDLVCFYQLGSKPPLLNIVDLPGYGHAIASSKAVQNWGVMIRNYFTDRHVISRCCVLVDCCRGLCSGDRSLIRMMHKSGIQVQIVMTKADLLSVELLAKSIAIVRSDVIELLDEIERGCSRSKIDKSDNEEGDKDANLENSKNKDTNENNYDSIEEESIGGVNIEKIVAESDSTVVAASTLEAAHEESDNISTVSVSVDKNEPIGSNGIEDNVECAVNEDDIFRDDYTVAEPWVPCPDVSATEFSDDNAITNWGKVDIDSHRIDSNLKTKKKLGKKTIDSAVVVNITKEGVWPLRLPPHQIVIAVSSSTGAGVNELWKQIKECAYGTAIKNGPNGTPLPKHAVLEHVNCALLRRKPLSLRRTKGLGDVLKYRVPTKKIATLR